MSTTGSAASGAAGSSVAGEGKRAGGGGVQTTLCFGARTPHGNVRVLAVRKEAAAVGDDTKEKGKKRGSVVGADNGKRKKMRVSDKEKEAEKARKLKEKEEEKARKQREKEEEKARKQREKEEEKARKQREKEEEKARKQREKEKEKAHKLREKEEEKARKLREKEEEKARKQRAKEEEKARKQREREEEKARNQREREEEKARKQREREEERQRECARIAELVARYIHAHTCLGTAADVATAVLAQHPGLPCRAVREAVAHVATRGKVSKQWRVSADVQARHGLRKRSATLPSWDVVCAGPVAGCDAWSAAVRAQLHSGPVHPPARVVRALVAALSHAPARVCALQALACVVGGARMAAQPARKLAALARDTTLCEGLLAACEEGGEAVRVCVLRVCAFALHRAPAAHASPWLDMLARSPRWAHVLASALQHRGDARVCAFAALCVRSVLSSTPHATHAPLAEWLPVFAAQADTAASRGVGVHKHVLHGLAALLRGSLRDRALAAVRGDAVRAQMAALAATATPHAALARECMTLISSPPPS